MVVEMISKRKENNFSDFKSAKSTCILLAGCPLNMCLIRIRGILIYSSVDQFITSMAILPYWLVLPNLLLFFSRFSFATDTLTQFESLPDGQTLVSENEIFELGFFSPGSSTDRYVGIWYHEIPGTTVVWVANRGRPIKNNSGMLSINTEGRLVLLGQNETVVWSANSTTKAWSPILQLLGSGNLVLRDGKDQKPQTYLWQSFDYPSDTILPGMKFGWDLRTGLNRRFTAWKNWDDPSFGDFTAELVLHNYPDLVNRQGPTEYMRSGPWNGVRFSGISYATSNPLYEATFVWNKDEVYSMHTLKNKSLITRFVYNQTLYSLLDVIWSEDDQRWITFSFAPIDNCDRYNRCGPNGNCVLGETPICQCLTGFLPKSPKNWNAMDWSQGCIRNESWSCKEKNRDYFVKFSGLKFPDTTYSWVNASMTLEECKAKCWENCSCNAYANLDIRGGGSGCAMWFGDLIDIRQIPFDDQNLYIRLASPETAEQDEANGNKTKVIAVTVPTILAVVMLFTLLYIYKRRRNSKATKEEGSDRNMELKNLLAVDKEEGREGNMEQRIYDLALIANATNNFSSDNKLGQGGFGPVYRGILADGQEIAVKRLSRSSCQGLCEFKNEVKLCAKLQHRNLVKVLGCCIQGEEIMLIYEYMPNKSLDSFIFGSETKLLDWSKRFHIVRGIARGLMYLHQDSRLRIIHRDLKASNILLDSELNPKISDFGLARIFGGDQIEDNTKQIVGTYGYMAPEYAIHGLFSIKSDVFSFGVLLLEIVSGMKNRGPFLPSQSVNLIGHAWRLWNEGIPLKFADGRLGKSCVESEVVRCIHIGLLCLQYHADDRPDMPSVVIMLSSEGVLPKPKEPGFLLENIAVKGESSNNHTTPSSNETSITLLEAR
ncbi:G-type lectin S-receptor-like serine/threonine-protein kinase At4g27290 isoform X2 [Neltuma alba]|uniref:G-type lectin S-receptor-like serine/threonine-protein kinase At4g27290 isoform X2 n=2 Tax=Neltuma alba TaxID=207710 RepID=UPI0010A3671D|nr:G-type lectin S-receptor-like serine/threonine-protein kinase At4g27290 isoform X2 [Prosopis alba]